MLASCGDNQRHTRGVWEGKRSKKEKDKRRLKRGKMDQVGTELHNPTRIAWILGGLGYLLGGPAHKAIRVATQTIFVRALFFLNDDCGLRSRGIGGRGDG